MFSTISYSSDVSFIQILLIFLIYINYTYGCISISQNKPTDTSEKSASFHNSISTSDKKSKSYISLYKTLENIQKNHYPAEEYLLLIKFTEFLKSRNIWNIDIQDMEFLWMSLKEFAMENEHLWRNQKWQNINHNDEIIQPQKPSYITLEDMDTYLEAVKMKKRNIRIRGVLGQPSRTGVVSKRGNKMYDSREMTLAMKYARHFYTNSCGIQKRVFCIAKYMHIINITKDTSLTLFVPHGILYHRCMSQCTCLSPRQVCVPTSTSYLEVYVYTSHPRSRNGASNQFTWSFMLVNHTSCGCRDQCQGRRCIEPFELETREDHSCYCKCKTGYEKTCTKVLLGQRGFTESDYTCLVKGTCLYPKCRAGELSEEYLYARRCPSFF